MTPRSLVRGAAFAAAFLVPSTRADQLVAAQIAKIHNPTPGGSDAMGVRVAMQGDRMVVGAFGDDTPAGQDAGSAFVYQRQGDDWVLTDHLQPAGLEQGDELGLDVDLDGDTIVVGAWRDDDQGQDAGAVYVFVRQGGTWTEQAKLVDPAGAAGDRFGYAVALDGDRLVVGAPYDDGPGMAMSGAAHVFRRSGTLWSHVVQLAPSQPQADARFGVAVDVLGNVALVGANLEDAPQNARGAAYAFARTAGVWVETARLLAPNGDTTDEFGVDVALDGTRAVIGARGDDSAIAAGGAVHVFDSAAGPWTFETTLTAGPYAASLDQFGASLDFEADTLVVGAWLRHSHQSDDGAAFVFRRIGGSWTAPVQLTASDALGNDKFGNAVAVAGDSVCVGAYFEDDPFSESGSVYAFELSYGDFGAFGAGDGVDQPCPCGNDTPPDLAAGCANSSGLGGRLAPWGSDSASTDDLRFAACNLVPNNAAILISGTDVRAPGTGVGVGAGLLFSQGDLIRRGLEIPDADGQVFWGPNLGGSHPWMVGNTYYFQAWYRDPMGGPCGATSNMTNGIAVTFH